MLSKELLSGVEFGCAWLSLEHFVFLELETERPHVCRPMFQSNYPWHPPAHNCTSLIVTEISPCSVKFNSKEVRTRTRAEMWICKNFHLALLQYNKVSDHDDPSIVTKCYGLASSSGSPTSELSEQWDILYSHISDYNDW